MSRDSQHDLTGSKSNGASISNAASNVCTSLITSTPRETFRLFDGLSRVTILEMGWARYLDRPPTVQLRTSSTARTAPDGKRGIKDRTNGGTDQISETIKDTHTHPKTISHFEARSCQCQRWSAE